METSFPHPISPIGSNGIYLVPIVTQEVHYKGTKLTKFTVSCMSLALKEAEALAPSILIFPSLTRSSNTVALFTTLIKNLYNSSLEAKRYQNYNNPIHDEDRTLKCSPMTHIHANRHIFGGTSRFFTLLLSYISRVSHFTST